MGTSISPVLFTRPAKANTLVPLLFSVPIPANQAAPLRRMGATLAKVSPKTLTFASQKVGTKSTPQTVTVTNEGSAAMQFSGVSVGGRDYRDFTETDNCTGRSISQGASCTVNVTFAPTKAGTRSATLSIEAVGTTSPAPVALLGTGS